MWVDKYCYSQYQVASYTFSELIDKYVDIQTKYDLIDVISFLKKNCNNFIVHKQCGPRYTKYSRLTSLLKISIVQIVHGSFKES